MIELSRMIDLSQYEENGGAATTGSSEGAVTIIVEGVPITEQTNSGGAQDQTPAPKTES